MNVVWKDGDFKISILCNLSFKTLKTYKALNGLKKLKKITFNI